MAQNSLVGHDLFIAKTSRSCSDKPHAVRILWTSDLLDAVTVDVYASGRIQTHNPNKRAAAVSPFRLRGHWDRPTLLLTVRILKPLEILTKVFI